MTTTDHADDERQDLVVQLLHWAGHPRSAADFLQVMYDRLPREPRAVQDWVIDACVQLEWQSPEGAERLRRALRDDARRGWRPRH